MKREPIWRRYARLFGADARADTEDELSFHYEMRVRDYLKRGLDEASARAAARERLGDLSTVREECGARGERYVRADRRREWLSGLRQDLKYGARVLGRSPVFALVAVLTLALGIGATTAIFSVVHRVLLTPLSYGEPDRLVNVWEHSPQGNDHNVVSAGNYVDWSQRTQSFEVMGAQQGMYGMALSGAGEPSQVTVNSLTPSTMRVLGAPPLVGRTLAAEDERGRGDVVVLSHAFWQQRFGGARTVIGQRMILDGLAYTIIGVMPRSFAFPSDAVQLWLPLRANELDATERRSHNYRVAAKLKPAVTIAQAQAELSALARVLAREHPQFMTGWDVNVVGLHQDLTAAVRPLLFVLLGTVAVVLLIACGNLANLLLARAVARTGEFALRSALGAGRARIARQLMTESLVIGLSGGVLGVLLAASTLRMLLAAAPDNIPLLQQVSLNWSVLAFAAAVTLFSILVFGLMPALRLARSDLQATLREGRGTGIQHARLRGALLVAEVTLSVVLLVGAGLLVRSFVALQRIDLGYQANNLLVMTIDLPRARYSDTPQQIDFYERLVTRLATVAQVVAVAGTSLPPGGGQAMTFSFGIQGRQAANPSGREEPEELHAITPDYFRTLGVPLLRGRAFTASDRADAPPVVIINQALAKKHWPNQDAVGQRIAFRPGEAPWLEIAGVVGNTRMASPDADPVPALYLPHAQKTWPWLSWLSIIARIAPGVTPTDLQPRLQAALWELDAQLPIQAFGTVDERYGATLARRSFAMTMVLTFALVALALSIVGLYGLMAYTVAQQRREFGIRLALGARSTDIVRSVMRRSLGLTTFGLALGLAASLGTTRFLSTLLYDVAPNDPLTLALITAVVLLTAGLASWLPAYRAVRSDPLAALKGT